MQWGRHRTEHSTISSQLQTQPKAALRAAIWVTLPVPQVCEMGLGSSGHRAPPPGHSVLAGSEVQGQRACCHWQVTTLLFQFF